MENETGLVQIYCGDGKGKTTAAMGLALRAIGAGRRVVIAQFLKDGDSSELTALRSFPDVTIFSGKAVSGFSFSMNEEEKRLVTENHNTHLNSAIALCETGVCDLLILDEILGALSTQLVDRARLLRFLKEKPTPIEVVMTGRNPDEELLSFADYISEVKKIRHPFDKGIKARKGIEY